MTSVYNLNNNVNIADLYKDLTSEQIDAIKKASSGGFTLDELKSLEEDGIDTSLIKQNSTKDTETKTAKSDTDIQSRADEIAEKYVTQKFSGSGDPYSSSNPELLALDKALDDGVIKILADEGFSKNQIVQIIGAAFPSVGINASGEGDAYNRPYGHGEEAQKIYSRFSSHLVAATGMDSKEIQAKKAELATINNQIAYNNHEMQVLEVTIEALQDEVEKQIQDAIDESKDIQEESKKKAQESVKKNISAYTNSNGEMTYDEFKNGVSSDLKGIQTKSGRELSEVVTSLLDANYKMSLLKEYVSDLGSLNDDNKELSEKATTVKGELDDLVAEAMESGESDPDAECTDPIGFSTDAARYDFFVDKDENGDITNENEFLGADTGFEEMKALDTDGDGLVTGAELDKANVKIVQTNKDGTQQIVSASDIFKNSMDGINLNSYKNTNEDIGDGNKLLGTFSASLNGETLNGYQTLDTHEWLDENYEFTDEVDGTGRFAQDISEIETAYDSSEKINIFTINNTNLDDKLKEAWNAWGFSEDMAQTLVNAANSEAKRKGEAISNKFEEIAQNEKELAEWTEEEMEADKEKWKELEEADAEEAEDAETDEIDDDEDAEDD